jgi:predicted RNA-binding protein
MCEFTVYLKGEKVMEDVIFARADDRGVVLKDVMGDSKSFTGARIVEVNVVSTRLVIEG